MPEPAARPDPPAAASFDWSRLRDLVGGDPVKIKWYADMFVQVAGAGLDELVRAADQRDADEVRRLAHKLKGSCGMVGAAAMAEVAADLERAAGSGRLDGVQALIGHLQRRFVIARAAVSDRKVTP